MANERIVDSPNHPTTQPPNRPPTQPPDYSTNDYPTNDYPTIQLLDNPDWNQHIPRDEIAVVAQAAFLLDCVHPVIGEDEHERVWR